MIYEKRIQLNEKSAKKLIEWEHKYIYFGFSLFAFDTSY